MSTMTMEQATHWLSHFFRVENGASDKEVQVWNTILAHLTSREAKGDEKPVAWMYPKIVSFKNAVRTSCPPELQPEIEGTVAWHPEVYGEEYSVTDKHGVTHHSYPLYRRPAPQQAAQPAEQPRDEVLDAPAKVGAVTFGEGVTWSSVIACAQRAYAHKDGPTPTPEQIEEFRSALLLQPKPEQAVGDGVDGWRRMTEEARRIQMRHLDKHEGDVYHAMQSLCVKFGKRREGQMIENIPSPAVATAGDGVRETITNTLGFEFSPGELQTVNESDLLRLAAALASRPVEAAQGGVAEATMFWDDSDPETCEESIHNVCVQRYDNGAEHGDVITVQRAIRLPDVDVRLIVDEDGDVDYEEVAAAPEVQS